MTRRYPVSPILPVRVYVTHPRAAAPLWQAPVASLNTAAMLHRPTAISMPQMLDEHVTPVGLPLGINEQEKQMWVAMYAAARKLVALGDCATPEEATKRVTADWGKSKGRDSREFIFALRWSKSVSVVLNMKEDFRFCDGAYHEPGHS